MQSTELHVSPADSGAIPTAVGGAHVLFRVARVLVVALVVAAAVLVAALAVGPRFLPYRTYTIETGSMRPTLPIGSQIVLRPVAANRLKVGDVVAFHRPGHRELVTHRIRRVLHTSRGTFFETKGDANGAPDPWRLRMRGTGWREVYVIPYVGYVVSALRLLSVRLTLLALVGGILGAFAIRRIWAAPRDASA